MILEFFPSFLIEICLATKFAGAEAFVRKEVFFPKNLVTIFKLLLKGCENADNDI